MLSHVPLFVTPWTIACQAPLSMEFSRQEYWSGLSFSSPMKWMDFSKNKPQIYKEKFEHVSSVQNMKEIYFFLSQKIPTEHNQSHILHDKHNRAGCSDWQWRKSKSHHSMFNNAFLFWSGEPALRNDTIMRMNPCLHQQTIVWNNNRRKVCSTVKAFISFPTLVKQGWLSWLSLQTQV